jgi:1-aminocyclopropane-1-carboxylate deaminase
MYNQIIQTNKIVIHHICTQNSIRFDVLRFDEIDAVVSGNKFFKLKLYLENVLAQNATTIATFGGAYSNHIVATAFVCKKLGLKSIGIIRGEEPKKLSHTLVDAMNYGMHLIFTERSYYRNKKAIQEKYQSNNWFWINEGGYGIAGANGAAEMYNWIDDSYTHILLAAGTGTMMAGFIKAAKKHQQIIGVNVMKGNENLINEVEFLLTDEEKKKNYILLNDYHFGGYAKPSKELFNFMNKVWDTYKLPTDFVYNSKTIFACFDLMKKNYFSPQSKILAIQCGGLQGNLSLNKNILHF